MGEGEEREGFGSERGDGSDGDEDSCRLRFEVEKSKGDSSDREEMRQAKRTPKTQSTENKQVDSIRNHDDENKTTGKSYER